MKRIIEFLLEENTTDTAIIKGLQVLCNILFLILCIKWLVA
jgi:hypothetical protein